MLDIKYKIYGRIQWLYHAFKGRNKKSIYKVYYAYRKDDRDLFNNKHYIINGENNNKLLFKGDNIVEGSNICLGNKLPSVKLKVKNQNYTETWLEAINAAKVEHGWRNSDFYLTAYIKEKKQWCLSNWIWTSAAIARILSKCNSKNEAKSIADAFLREQFEEGYWIVRYDFIKGSLCRLAAPNDSAYIARNAILTAYHDTKEEKYLLAAEKCAKWIIDTQREDSLVYFGYNIDKKEWIINSNIVDIGFTADLFAELYNITSKDIYKEFMISFIKSYIDTFYDSSAGLFISHITGYRKRNGGYFSRGQAWAIEGLIPVYSITKDSNIFEILETVSSSIVKNQLKNGGWYCNLQKTRSLMGEDCKGISAIAANLLRWADYSNHRDELIDSAKKALKWCEDHTDPETGMILSYSCNGAIAHSPNTSTGILYANAYAIEIKQLLSKHEIK